MPVVVLDLLGSLVKRRRMALGEEQVDLFERLALGLGVEVVDGGQEGSVDNSEDDVELPMQGV